jgi:hypothetical protein
LLLQSPSGQLEYFRVGVETLNPTGFVPNDFFIVGQTNGEIILARDPKVYDAPNVVKASSSPLFYYAFYSCLFGFDFYFFALATS